MKKIIHVNKYIKTLPRVKRSKMLLDLMDLMSSLDVGTILHEVEALGPFKTNSDHLDTLEEIALKHERSYLNEMP